MQSNVTGIINVGRSSRRWRKNSPVVWGMSEHTYFGRGFSVVDEDPVDLFVANSLDDLLEVDGDDDDDAADEGKGKL